MKNYRGILIAFAVLLILFNSCKSEFSFIQISDPQFGFISNNKDMTEETRLYERAVAKVNEMKPAFVVITGDLVNDKSNKAQWDEFRRITSEFSKRIKVYIVPGNHDLGHELTGQDMKEYESLIGPDRFSAEYKKCTFIGINSNLIKSGVQPLEEEQLKWLKDRLAAAKGSEHVIIFCHHPFFIHDAAEPEQYFNIEPGKRSQYLSLFKQNGVDAIFAGHLHENAEASSDNIIMVTTSSVGKQLGKEKPGFRLVTIDGKKISHQYIPVEE